MKTKLFSALLLGAALVFVGCEQTNKPGTEPTDPDKPTSGTNVEGISVSPSEVTLEYGGSIRLSYTLTPDGATGDVVWSSEDTTIATVTSKGYVEAVGYGTVNITATCGEHSASCAVTIKTYLETLEFSGATYMSIDTTYYGSTVYPITASDGSEYKCYMAACNIWLMSDGFIVNNSGYLDGGTTVSYIDMTAPVFYAPAWLNPAGGGRGTIFILGEFGIDATPSDSVIHHLALGGSIDESTYISYLEQFAAGWNEGMNSGDENKIGNAYNYLSEATDNAITGATLVTMTYHTTAEGYSSDGYYLPFIPDAIAPTGSFSVSSHPTNDFMLSVDYTAVLCKPIANDDQYTWGCNWDFDEETGIITWVDKTLHYGDDLHYVYGTLPAESPKFVPVQAPILSLDRPDVYNRIQSQIKGMDTKTLRVKK